MAADKYTEEQYQALKYSYEQFDKNVLFIASGALGISFAFIEKIIPNLKQATVKCLLIDSWYCFAGVIFMCLVAHFVSSQAISWAIRNNPSVNKHYNRTRSILNWIIRILNISMIIGLLVGIISLIRFINLNIS
jgi:hypothetical protein